MTVDQVDQAKTAVTAREQAVQQQRSQVLARRGSGAIRPGAIRAGKSGRRAEPRPAWAVQHSVLTLDPLTAQREGRASAIRTAEYNLNNCKVVAPFDARVTNLTISQGAYAHTGQQVFTLIDTRVWWAVANFRETQLHHIQPGMHADVYVLSRPWIRYHGVVDSVGFGVRPDSTLVGTFACSRIAGHAAFIELGASRHALSGKGPHRCAGDRTFPDQRVRGGGHSRRREGEVAMATQTGALPAARQHAIDQGRQWFWNFLKTRIHALSGPGLGVGRVTISATIVMLLVMTFRIPGGFLGAIFTLFITRENPTATFVSGFQGVLAFLVATVYVVFGVMLLVDDPLTHFLWVASASSFRFI